MLDVVSGASDVLGVSGVAVVVVVVVAVVVVVVVVVAVVKWWNIHLFCVYTTFGQVQDQFLNFLILSGFKPFSEIIMT